MLGSPDLLHWLAYAATGLAVIGLGQAAAGYVALRRFAARSRPPIPSSRPPVSLLKPLYGDEALLEAALASNCVQDYPNLQILFGVKSADDPALAVVDRLRARFPQCDIAVVINPAEHGDNRKIGNLINMLPAAKHDVLVIADSDVHVAPDYLDIVVASLGLPGVGLVTTLYAGLPSGTSLAGRLGATAITHGFLPGALLARELGRQDCLGATMALRRATLHAIGGLEALVDHLGDDQLLGRLVQRLGLHVHLAATVTATTVPETDLPSLLRHELRWARTILSFVPVEFAASALQYPIAWTLLAFALSGGAPWAIAAVALTWLGRAAIARGLDARLGLAQCGLASPAPIWLLPLRDLLSIAVLVASYAGDRVEWRGNTLHATPMPDDAATTSHPKLPAPKAAPQPR